MQRRYKRDRIAPVMWKGLTIYQEDDDRNREITWVLTMLAVGRKIKSAWEDIKIFAKYFEDGHRVLCFFLATEPLPDGSDGTLCFSTYS
jgi:hypothetical protein